MPKQTSKTIKAIKKILPAVVSITMTKNLELQETKNKLSINKIFKQNKKSNNLGGGSGFIISSNGIILTNRHVIENKNADYLVVLQNDEKLVPEILASDPIHDVAVLKINKKGLKFAKLGDSQKIELGQEVIAIGNALGLFKNTVSTGVVSGLSREIDAQNTLSEKQTKLRGLIQTDAAINPGNSGGPLIDLNGKVIGINAAMIFGAENIGFALPINNAKKDLAELKKYGRIREPFLGVRYMEISRPLQQKLGLPVDFGALVMSEPNIPFGFQQAVIPNSPAHRAGIKKHDIILEINNKKISQDLSIPDILDQCEIGRTIPICILRKGKQKILRLKLEEKI